MTKVLLKNPEENKPSIHLIVNNYLCIAMIIKCVPYKSIAYYPNGTVICDRKEITDDSANIIKNFICYWLKNKLKVYRKEVNE